MQDEENRSPVIGVSLFPGLFLTGTIALAVSFVSTNLGGPTMLYALLFGLAFHFLAGDERFAAGIDFASSAILRVGVALLGVRITFDQVADLGWSLATLVAAAVVATILVGWLFGRLCGLNSSHSLLSSSAVAICGASAALAVASVLPAGKDHERNTTLTVVGVTVLSTIAMIAYPVFVTSIGLDDTTAGVFLGATIHDVAQVVGAGYIVSESAGDVSTLVKLFRVAFLVPVVFVILLLANASRRQSGPRTQLLPWFLVAFLVLVIANSLGWLPQTSIDVMIPASRWCLLVAIAAIGVRTSLESIAKVGLAPVGAMVLQTVFLACFVLGGLYLLAAL